MKNYIQLASMWDFGGTPVKLRGSEPEAINVIGVMPLMDMVWGHCASLQALWQITFRLANNGSANSQFEFEMNLRGAAPAANILNESTSVVGC